MNDFKSRVKIGSQSYDIVYQEFEVVAEELFLRIDYKVIENNEIKYLTKRFKIGEWIG